MAKPKDPPNDLNGLIEWCAVEARKLAVHKPALEALEVQRTRVKSILIEKGLKEQVTPQGYKALLVITPAGTKYDPALVDKHLTPKEQVACKINTPEKTSLKIS